MKEFKGTKGPWQLRGQFQVVGASVKEKNTSPFMPGIVSLDPDSNGTYISMTYEERASNAKSIAALPELIEALQDGVELMEYLINALPTGKVRNTATDWNIIARAALNKALD